jgi:hypothetical protein
MYENKYINLLISIARRANFITVRTLLLAGILALTAIPALAEDWTTSDGMVYQDVQVLRVEDDAVTILYKDGGALVPLVKLPRNLQMRFDYDPDKAKVAAAARAKADVESAKQLQAEIDLTNKLKLQQEIKDSKGTTNNGTGR